MSLTGISSISGIMDASELGDDNDDSDDDDDNDGKDGSKFVIGEDDMDDNMVFGIMNWLTVLLLRKESPLRSYLSFGSCITFFSLSNNLQS